MQEIIATTPGQRSERRVRVRYERRERDDRQHLYLSVMVADTEQTEVRVSVIELLSAVLRESGIQ
jgi:hypothetical protein